ncbi:MAG: hypothetical protein NZM31_15270 [Gemmatales bacterium]|nr:hypothetical protein [Gemmatales bacterium]MDW8388357.1 hypothetical protein [Gemmatales bacterium]
MSNAAQRINYPLGLPPGSVRAILSIFITGMFLVLAVYPVPEGSPPLRIPLFLFALLPMVLLFYIAHGRSIRPPDEKVYSPLYLPRGTIRVLLTVAFLGILGYQYFTNHDELIARLTPDPAEVWKVPPLMFAIMIGFLIGHVLRIGPWSNSPIYQNFMAWASLIALLLLVVDVVLEFFVKPSVQGQFDFDPFTFEAILCAVIAFYFGARS